MKGFKQDTNTEKMTLAKYYTTKHWKEIVKKHREDKEVVCEICNKKRWIQYRRKTGYKQSQAFHVHHKVYHLFHEKRGDYMILCSSCHTFGHDLEMMARTRDSIYRNMYEEFKIKTGWRFEKYE